MEEDVTTEGPQPAILVRGVTKKYGNEANVLDNLNMTVMKGTIYGLLGASGCGKTTLLGAILGSRTIQNGSISILGEPPGVVPVKSIGYMPQDIALVGELSIRNVLQQQGWIFGMSNKEIEERHKLCEKLLDLPPGNRLIKNLSGGQQRRVSLAVVLIQDPELLILDEPTVGLDPVLRQNLWDYLIKITKEDKKTVVITTHYIEEAKQADTVAMLRHGKLIAEEEPQTLMNRLNYNSLEDLFVSLSAQQDQNDPNVNYIQQQNTLISKADELKILNQQIPKKSRLKELFFINRGHTKALLSKNFIRYIRNPASLIITLCIPIIQISAAFLAIGNIPEDLTIGIVNQELGEYENCDLYTQNNSVGGYRVDEFGTCMFQGLSCKFTQGFRDIIKYQVFFDSMEDALKAVKNKKISQILFFPQNYSEAYTEVTNSNDVPPEELNFGKFAFYRDEIDNPLGLYVEKELYNFYLKFSEELANDCEWSKRSARIPLLFNEPIYGKTELSFADFVAPGIMAITLLFLPMILAVTTIINEKRDGIWERTIVSGIKPVEIIICHTAALSVTSAIQTFECVILSCYVFGFESKGNLLYAALLLYQLAFLGISIGIFLSVLCRMEIEAIFGASAVGYPMLMLSGVVWPLEGQPSYLKFFSYFVASTIPVESLNNIFFRGWDIFHFDVYKGYLVTTGYICLCFVLCVLGLKFKKL